MSKVQVRVTAAAVMGIIVLLVLVYALGTAFVGGDSSALADSAHVRSLEEISPDTATSVRPGGSDGGDAVSTGDVDEDDVVVGAVAVEVNGANTEATNEVEPNTAGTTEMKSVRGDSAASNVETNEATTTPPATAAPAAGAERDPAPRTSDTEEVPVEATPTSNPPASRTAPERATGDTTPVEPSEDGRPDDAAPPVDEEVDGEVDDTPLVPVDEAPDADDGDSDPGSGDAPDDTDRDTEDPDEDEEAPPAPADDADESDDVDRPGVIDPGTTFERPDLLPDGVIDDIFTRNCRNGEVWNGTRCVPFIIDRPVIEDLPEIIDVPICDPRVCDPLDVGDLIPDEIVTPVVPEITKPTTVLPDIDTIDRSELDAVVADDIVSKLPTAVASPVVAPTLPGLDKLGG